jgi:hypothetical protein
LTQRRRELAALRRGRVAFNVNSGLSRVASGFAAMETRLRIADSADGRRGLLEWAEPVICDRLRDSYQRRLGAGGVAVGLARLHARVWRALIAGDEANYREMRAELVAAATRGGLEIACLDRGDAETMVELLDIVVLRFQRSERQASSYRLALFELAERLVARREVA